VKYCGPEGKVASTVCTLLEAGANANASPSSGNIALHLAAKHCQLEAIKLLLEHHSDVNAQRRHTRLAPLHKACGAVDYPKAKAVELLLDGGASLD
jgi:ankyrin repeat protein